jgi:hypothetical protein
MEASRGQGNFRWRSQRISRCVSRRLSQEFSFRCFLAQRDLLRVFELVSILAIILAKIFAEIFASLPRHCPDGDSRGDSTFFRP